MRPLLASAALLLTLLFGAFVVRAEEPPTSEDAGAPPAASDDAATSAEEIVWIEGMADGKRRAQTARQPMLIRAGAPWCGWCKRLETEMKSPDVGEALAGWLLVDVNVDDDPATARELGINGIPALRLLDARGRAVASLDGYLPADELIAWIKKQHQAAEEQAPDILTESGEPDDLSVRRLIVQLAQQDPLKREAAIRRLLAHPKPAAGATVAAFLEGVLATRLAALELLREWKAPIDELDPWRPETLTLDKLTALDTWSKSEDLKTTDPARKLTPEEQAEVERDLVRLLEAEDTTAEAMRERLSRWGTVIGPLVTGRLQETVDDRGRERLLALRYRLVAPESLVLSWPGGLERLASTDVKTRHRAVTELVERATSDAEPLLLELFKDPDPLIREVSLRGMQDVAGESKTSALITLLDDPEPNVRAAVLKQLAAHPSPALVPAIAAYVEREKDADLVIHAIRFLRATEGRASLDCLVKLFKHESWQVRADAAEAVGNLAATSHGDQSRRADAYVALIGLLDDADAFVVSRALAGVENSDLDVAVEPLARVVDKHPDLAAKAVEALTSGEIKRRKALPHLRQYATHKDPAVRAAAIGGLVQAENDVADKQLVAALNDPEAIVRLAGIQALQGMFDATRGEGRNRGENPLDEDAMREAVRFLFGASKAAVPTVVESQHDRWLADYQSGKERPEWMLAAIEPLKKMLSATDAKERLAAAKSLIPLGRAEVALPIIREIAQATPELHGEVGTVLPWLRQSERHALFNYLIGLKPGDEALAEIARGLAESGDARDAGLLWDLLKQDEVKLSAVSAVHHSLETLYGNDESGGFTIEARVETENEPPHPATKELLRWANQGTSWQRTVALALLLQFTRDETATAAQKVLDDSKTTGDFRRDALQIRLLALPEADAESTAVKFLSGEDLALKRMAIAYLSRGPEALAQLRGGAFYLSYQNGTPTSFAEASQPKQVTAPEGLSADALRPLLEDPDADTVAGTAYLLATLGQPDGLEKLLHYWRNGGGRAWTKTVYRAIAALDKDRHTKTLEEIYGSLEQYEMREFYWTIRSMHGPKIVQLRKRMREEVGMDNLQ